MHTVSVCRLKSSIHNQFAPTLFCIAAFSLTHTAEAAPQTPPTKAKTTATKTTATKTTATKTTATKPAKSSTKVNTSTKPSGAKKSSGSFRTVSTDKIFGAPHSGSRFAVHHSTKPFEVSTYQRFDKLENGLYTLRAWVKSSGGLTSTMSASAFDDKKTRKSISIPQTAEWKQIEIKDIKVANGKCTIGFYSKSPANKWIAFDDVEFFRQLSQETTTEEPKGNI